MLNTKPMPNGEISRREGVVRAPEVVCFGACLLSAPANELERGRRIISGWPRVGADGAPAVYTLDEAIQAAKFFFFQSFRFLSLFELSIVFRVVDLGFADDS